MSDPAVRREVLSAVLLSAGLLSTIGAAFVSGLPLTMRSIAESS